MTCNHRSPPSTIFRAVLWAFLILAAVLAGCLQAEDQDEGQGDVSENGNDDAGNGNETIPAPLVFNGTALVINPLQSAFACQGDGLDGGFHALGQDTSGWKYRVAPADTFLVYWWEDGDHLESAEDSGTVPRGATDVEVCNMYGVGPTDYTLTLIHPDHDDAW